MATISDLPWELVEKIFSKIPLTSLRAIRTTCKKWNSLSKNQIFGQKTGKEFMAFMTMDYKVYSFKFDEDMLHTCLNQVELLNNKFEISKVFHCDGLLLCLVKNNTGLILWNPYLCQTKLIQPKFSFHVSDSYALGYDNKRNHKILRVCDSGYYEVYDFRFDSWSPYNVDNDWDIPSYQRGVCLKGNAYFLALGKTVKPHYVLVCFDFSTEQFRQPIQLPFRTGLMPTVALACVGEDQLAFLHQNTIIVSVLEIWVTGKIDPSGTGVVSWSKFLRSLSRLSQTYFEYGSFFIDEEKKVAVVFDLDQDYLVESARWWSLHQNDESDAEPLYVRYQTAHIVGQDGYFMSVNIKEAPPEILGFNFNKHIVAIYSVPLVTTPYVPSLVQLQINQPRQRKQR